MDERDPDSFLVDRNLKPSEPEPAAGLDDRERTFLLGLGLVSAAFVLAEVLHSLAWAPFALLVPGIVLTLLGLASLLGSGE